MKTGTLNATMITSAEGTKVKIDVKCDGSQMDALVLQLLDLIAEVRGANRVDTARAIVEQYMILDIDKDDGN